MPDCIFYNGELMRASKWNISPDNRSFRYGDGFFETIKMVNGKIALAQLHMERLFSSLTKMHFQVPEYFTQDYLLGNIAAVARKNGHDKSARIRVTVFRGDGGLYDATNHFPHHLVQSWPLDAAYCRFDAHAQSVGVFEDARKSCDQYSALKSNNFLPYAMAALWAKANGLHDAILLNAFGRIADSTVANLFIVANNKVFTTPLDEGAVNGTMRRHLLECFRQHSIDHSVKPLTPEDMLSADELFLTNAVYGIRHVAKFNGREYEKNTTAEIYRRFVEPL